MGQNLSLWTLGPAPFLRKGEGWEVRLWFSCTLRKELMLLYRGTYSLLLEEEGA